MKKSRPNIALGTAAAILAWAVFFFRTIDLGRGAARPSRLEMLNPRGEFSGPEGIQFDARGNLYVGDKESRVWILERGGTPRIYAQLDQMGEGGAPAGPIRTGGLAFDSRGDLYVACHGYAGGAILRVDAGSRRPAFFARGMGSANGVVVTEDGRHLWASDFRSRGRLLRYPLGGTATPALPDAVIGGFSFPNGLALGREDQSLYVSESYSGEVWRVDLGQAGLPVETAANLKGRFAVASLDGLAFDPRDGRRRFLFVAENLRGLFTVLDLDARPARVVRRIRADLMGGRPCPASLAIRDGYLHFTDLWSCKPVLILLGIPNYHTHAWRLPVLDLTMLFPP